MSTERPKLPAALLAPQKCPPGRCRFPGTPLPPASPVILAAVNKFFFAQIRRELRPRCFRLVKEKRWESHADSRILELALAGLSPDAILAKLESKEERERTGAAIRRTWSTDQELCGAVSDVYRDVVITSALGSSDFIRFELARMANVREYSIVVDGEKELLCLHDALDPQNIEEWTALLDVHQVFPFFDVAPRANDPEPLLRKVNAKILHGDVVGPGWESPMVWRRKIKAASEASYRMLGELTMELISERRFIVMTVDAVEEMGSALPISSYLLFRPSIEQLSTMMFLRSSPLLEQLVNFTSQVATQPLTHLASAFPELDEFLPPTINPLSPLDTSLPPPSPVAPDKRFRRTKMVKNDSETFHFILKRVEPRCCAPDRCSGRTPATINDPAAPDYARVDAAITSLFLGCHSLTVMQNVLDWSEFYVILLGSVSTLDCGTPSEQFGLLANVERIAKEFLSSEKNSRESGFDALNETFRRFHGQIKTIYRQATEESRFPCLCDLVNNVDKVESLIRIHNKIVELAKGRRPVAGGCNLASISNWVREEIRGGRLRRECWKGESWKRQIVPFFRFVDGCLRSLDFETEGAMVPHERYRELFRVMGSSLTLSESLEVGSRPPHLDHTANHFVEMVIHSFGEDASTVDCQNELKDKGDMQVVKKEFQSAIIDYKISTVVTPVGSWASRLNLAAVRLRLANSGSQFYQYSMAIHDCTMALYYCPPKFKFKAYYRRGFALARLQLWKKAILDFEQALLIEPQNVLIKQELAAAKRMSKK